VHSPFSFFFRSFSFCFSFFASLHTSLFYVGTSLFFAVGSIPAPALHVSSFIHLDSPFEWIACYVLWRRRFDSAGDMRRAYFSFFDDSDVCMRILEALLRGVEFFIWEIVFPNEGAPPSIIVTEMRNGTLDKKGSILAAGIVCASVADYLTCERSPQRAEPRSSNIRARHIGSERVQQNRFCCSFRWGTFICGHEFRKIRCDAEIARQARSSISQRIWEGKNRGNGMLGRPRK
jgi:hypothetical protein